jgi:hypothetical protein
VPDLGHSAKNAHLTVTNGPRPHFLVTQPCRCRLLQRPHALVAASPHTRRQTARAASPCRQPGALPVHHRPLLRPPPASSPSAYAPPTAGLSSSSAHHRPSPFSTRRRPPLNCVSTPMSEIHASTMQTHHLSDL